MTSRNKAAVVSEMELTDIADVMDMIRELHIVRCETRPDIYAERENPVSDAYLTAIIGSKDSMALVARIDGQAAGICILSMKVTCSEMFVPRRIAFVDALYVRRAFRRQGVGAALYGAVRERAAAQRADSIELMVLTNAEDEISFFSSCGMTVKSNVMEMKLQEKTV